MGLFGKHDDDDESGTRRFQMRERLMSVGDDFWIEDESGRRAYKVDGKALHFRDTFVLEDASGRQIAKIQERKMTLRDTMEIEREGGNVTVRKAMVSLRDKFTIDVENGAGMEAHGKIGDHEYEIERDGARVARISKKWFRVRDSYGVEVEPGEDVGLVLALTVAIDSMSRG